MHNSTGADIRVVVKRVEFRKDELVEEYLCLGLGSSRSSWLSAKCICAWISWTRRSSWLIGPRISRTPESVTVHQTMDIEEFLACVTVHALMELMDPDNIPGRASAQGRAEEFDIAFA